MKNLKLFVAPLLGAALLIACGPKAIDVKDFRAKVEEKYNVETIKANYVGKTIHETGTNGEYKAKITGVATDQYFQIPAFTYKAEGEIGYMPSSVFSILSTALVDMLALPDGAEGKANYFISGDTYTISLEASSIKSSAKYVFKDLVISHYEMKAPDEDGKIVEQKCDFKYE